MGQLGSLGRGRRAAVHGIEKIRIQHTRVYPCAFDSVRRKATPFEVIETGGWLLCDHLAEA
jgi:hypothetical protein